MPRNTTKAPSAALTAPHPAPLTSLLNGQHTVWHAALTHHFPHAPSSFLDALYRMFLHPEHSSSWILRADILYDSQNPTAASPTSHTDPTPAEPYADVDISVPGFTATRTLVRRFAPRNPQRDAEATQTAVFLSATDPDPAAGIRELVVLLAHERAAEDVPYYLPCVAATAFLLSPAAVSTSTVSTSPISSASLSNAETPAADTPASAANYTITLLYAPFPTAPITPRLSRTALHLLTRASKLAHGVETGYTKRVYHDLLVAREVFQTRYVAMRARHAPRLVAGWREKTDPGKHVFEDILIAAFLCCLWEDMYGSAKEGWVGFVDIGCGNGVLVDILVREGWTGRGFDARERKSWSGFEEGTRAVLEERILVPWLLPGESDTPDPENTTTGTGAWLHDGRFPAGTFIISNHADELTPWTPLLAAASNCSFLAIPCCSHDLSGARKRFPPPKPLGGETGDLRNVNASRSTYASLCAYVERLAREVGWVVEREVLRIPSTRNMGILGRRRRREDVAALVEEVVRREGGGVGWRRNAEALRKGEVKGH
ncbi:hypothetical protein EDC01DRAFT_712265 [Geopyxis carbonaria]|nr:hypothetical protein EDC01DRAFT_712265 [Geopyxis carbonaria]